MSSILTAGSSVNISPRLPYQLIGSLLIPAIVVAVIAVAMCWLRSFLRKRREARRRLSVPLITRTMPSTATLHEAVEAAYSASESVNGHKYTSGLTVPLSARAAVSRMGVVSMPNTPYLHAQDDGCTVSYLGLDQTTVKAGAQGGSELQIPKPCIHA